MTGSTAISAGGAGGAGRPEGDAASALGWGLRHYGWVVVLTTLALGLLVPRVLGDDGPTQYDAQAQVAPVTRLQLPNLDAFPRTGDQVFTNGAVTDAVRRELDLGADDPVIPDLVELVAPQDASVYTVLGHGENAQNAAAAATAAAGTFTDELNKMEASMATFEVTRSATSAERQDGSTSGLPLLLAGLLAGLVLGLGAVAALVAWRRPVLSSAAVTRVTGAPVLARLQLGAAGEEIGGLPRLCHHLLSTPLQRVYLVGPASSAADRRQLAGELGRLLSGPRGGSSRPGRHRDWPEPAADGADDLAPVVVVDDPGQRELAVRPVDSLTLLVLPSGTPESSVRRVAESRLDGGATGVALVRRRHRAPRDAGRPSSSEDDSSSSSGGGGDGGGGGPAGRSAGIEILGDHVPPPSVERQSA